MLTHVSEQIFTAVTRPGHYSRYIYTVGCYLATMAMNLMHVYSDSVHIVLSKVSYRRIYEFIFYDTMYMKLKIQNNIPHGSRRHPS